MSNPVKIAGCVVGGVVLAYTVYQIHKHKTNKQQKEKQDIRNSYQGIIARKDGIIFEQYNINKNCLTIIGKLNCENKELKKENAYLKLERNVLNAPGLHQFPVNYEHEYSSSNKEESVNA